MKKAEKKLLSSPSLTLLLLRAYWCGICRTVGVNQDMLFWDLTGSLSLPVLRSVLSIALFWFLSGLVGLDLNWVCFSTVFVQLARAFVRLVRGLGSACQVDEDIMPLRGRFDRVYFRKRRNAVFWL